MNFYPFHIGDYASATRHLSWDEDMAYRRLIDAYYTREESIPLDRRKVYRLVMAGTQAQRDAVDDVLQEFFTETPAGWVHSRCEAEIKIYHQKSEKAAQSARARWDRTAERSRSDGSPGAFSGSSDRTESGCDRIDEGCERTESACEGNATKTKTKTKTNISKPKGLDSSPAEAGKPAKKGAPLPSDFVPNETGVAYAEQRGVQIESELKAFANWHTAKGTLFKDWQAAWRTWCDKAVEFGRAGNGRASPGTKFDPVAYVNQNRKGGRHDEDDERTIDGIAQRVA